MSGERFLVTGANGCIGAWVVARLVREGAPVVALDASDDDHRLRLLFDVDELAAGSRVRGDITDLAGSNEHVVGGPLDQEGNGAGGGRRQQHGGRGNDQEPDAGPQMLPPDAPNDLPGRILDLEFVGAPRDCACVPE